MPTFLLIRHGETDYNKKMRLAGRMTGIHLNNKGQHQAQLLADKLATAPIKAIYSSPLERTMETAGPLASALKLEIIPLAGLLETNCGEWQGQSVRKLRRQKVWRSLQGHPSLFRFPGGESIADCQFRMVQVFESLCKNHSPEDLVACFSHADPLKQVVAYAIGLPLDQFQRLAIDTASITALQILESGSRLIMLNYNLNLSWEALQLTIKPKPAAKQ
jgi:probable phosphomutase (TIGR03848 family)